MVANEKPASTFRYNEKPVYTTSNGYPIHHPSSWQRVGTNGPLLLQDFHLIDLLAHFDRERIPERVVHAKGAGAYGEFEVTDDISDITSIDMLTGVGKKTPCVTRFSTVGGEKGSADSARDPRGMKFATRNTQIQTLIAQLQVLLSSSTLKKETGIGFTITPLSSSFETPPTFPSSSTPRSVTLRPT